MTPRRRWMFFFFVVSSFFLGLFTRLLYVPCAPSSATFPPRVSRIVCVCMCVCVCVFTFVWLRAGIWHRLFFPARLARRPPSRLYRGFVSLFRVPRITRARAHLRSSRANLAGRARSSFHSGSVFFGDTAAVASCHRASASPPTGAALRLRLPRPDDPHCRHPPPRCDPPAPRWTSGRCRLRSSPPLPPPLPPSSKPTPPSTHHGSRLSTAAGGGRPPAGGGRPVAAAAAPSAPPPLPSRGCSAAAAADGPPRPPRRRRCVQPARRGRPLCGAAVVGRRPRRAGRRPRLGHV